jgi:sugar lactone lactonase YvrE
VTVRGASLRLAICTVAVVAAPPAFTVSADATGQTNAVAAAAPATPPSYVSQIFNAAGIPPLSPNATALATGGVHAGTLYASDEAGLRIVSVNQTTGALTTVSPSSDGWSHPSGLFIESDQQHMLVADKDNNRIAEIDLSTGAIGRTWGGTSGPDAGAFNAPEDMIMSAGGTIYLTDTYNYRIVALSASTGSILWSQASASPANGSGCDGSALLRSRGIAFGSDGNLYVADTDQGRIVKLNPSTGACLAVLGGKGTALGRLGEPRGIWSDGGSGLWVAMNSGSIIQHISLTGTSLYKSPTTFGGGANQFRSPHGVQVVGGKIYVSDTYDYRIAIYTPSGNGANFSKYISEPYPAAGGFNGPFGVAYDASGNLYVVDHFNNRVEEFDSTNSFIGQVGGGGPPLGAFNFPRGILVIPSTSTTWANDVMVNDSENHRMQIFTPGSFNPGGYGTLPIGHLTPIGTTFLRPQQIFLSPVDGSLWAADTNHHRILDITLSGTVLHVWDAAGNTRPAGIAVDSAGNVYVTGTNLSEYSAGGSLIKVVAPNGGALGDVRAPDGIAISGTTMYVADTNNNRVDAFDLSNHGAYLFSFGSVGSGNGQFHQPYMVAVSRLGLIAVSDFGNNRISIWH